MKKKWLDFAESQKQFSKKDNKETVSQTERFRLLDVFLPSDWDRGYRLKDVFPWTSLGTLMVNMSGFPGIKWGQSWFYIRPFLGFMFAC